MNDVSEAIIISAAGIVIANYLPGAIKSIVQILVFFRKLTTQPISRLISFPFIRYYRDNYKKYELPVVKFKKISSIKQEFFHDWKNWTIYGGSCPMSSRELRKYYEREEKYNNFQKTQDERYKKYLEKEQRISK